MRREVHHNHLFQGLRKNRINKTRARPIPFFSVSGQGLMLPPNFNAPTPIAASCYDNGINFRLHPARTKRLPIACVTSIIFRGDYPWANLFWRTGVVGGYSPGEYSISHETEPQAHQRRKGLTKITGKWLSDSEKVDCDASPTEPAPSSFQ